MSDLVVVIINSLTLIISIKLTSRIEVTSRKEVNSKKLKPRNIDRERESVHF